MVKFQTKLLSRKSDIPTGFNYSNVNFALVHCETRQTQLRLSFVFWQR